MHSVRVPDNLDLEEMIVSNPPTTFRVTQRSIEMLYYYCSVLVQLRIKHGGYNETNNGFIPLHSRYLKTIHESYIDYLNYLVEVDILESDGRYIKGEKSKGYKFNTNYIGVPLKVVELKDFVLCKNIKRQQADRLKLKKQRLRKYDHILKWFISGGLEIDAEAALSWVSSQYQQATLNIMFSDASDKELEAKKLYDVWQASRIFVERLHNHDFGIEDFSTDDFGRRLHGMFTYQRKELRNFISFRDCKLVSVDIKNSQPYFSTLLLDGDFWKSKKTNTTRVKISEINGELYGRIRKKGRICESIKWLNSSKRLIRQRISTCRYKEDAVNGSLYENFERKLQEQLPPDYIEKYADRVVGRDGVKKEVLRTLYCKNSVLHWQFYLPSRVFHSSYPDAMRFFKVIKQENHKLLAEIIQQIESFCVLNLICGRIARERPKLPIFTIHDSVVTTLGNEQYVKDVIIDVLSLKVGAPPQLKIEIWDRSNPE